MAFVIMRQKRVGTLGDRRAATALLNAFRGLSLADEPHPNGCLSAMVGAVTYSLCQIGDREFVMPLLNWMRQWKPGREEFPTAFTHFLEPFPDRVLPVAMEALKDPNGITSGFAGIVRNIVQETRSHCPRPICVSSAALATRVRVVTSNGKGVTTMASLCPREGELFP